MWCCFRDELEAFSAQAQLLNSGNFRIPCAVISFGPSLSKMYERYTFFFDQLFATVFPPLTTYPRPMKYSHPEKHIEVSRRLTFSLLQSTATFPPSLSFISFSFLVFHTRPFLSIRTNTNVPPPLCIADRPNTLFIHSQAVSFLRFQLPPSPFDRSTNESS